MLCLTLNLSWSNPGWTNAVRLLLLLNTSMYYCSMIMSAAVIHAAVAIMPLSQWTMCSRFFTIYQKKPVTN